MTENDPEKIEGTLFDTQQETPEQPPIADNQHPHHVREALNSKLTRLIIGIVVVLILSPFINAMWMQQAQFNKDRSALYHDSVKEYYNLKMLVWEAGEYCEKNVGVNRDPDKTREYLEKVNDSANDLLRQSPGISIEYYFSGDIGVHFHRFVLWFEKNKHRICTETGTDEEIYTKIRKEWPEKLYSPMREEMYSILPVIP